MNILWLTSSLLSTHNLSLHWSVKRARHSGKECAGLTMSHQRKKVIRATFFPHQADQSWKVCVSQVPYTTSTTLDNEKFSRAIDSRLSSELTFPGYIKSRRKSTSERLGKRETRKIWTSQAVIIYFNHHAAFKISFKSDVQNNLASYESFENDFI